MPQVIFEVSSIHDHLVDEVKLLLSRLVADRFVAGISNRVPEVLLVLVGVVIELDGSNRVDFIVLGLEHGIAVRLLNHLDLSFRLCSLVFSPLVACVARLRHYCVREKYRD